MLVVWAAILSSSVSSPVPWRTIQALISKSHMTGGIVMVRLTRCQFMIRVNQPFSQKRSLMALQLINQYESTTQSWRPYLGIRFWLTNTEIFFSDSECIFQNFSEISETGSVTITETISGLVTMVTISFSKFNLLLGSDWERFQLFIWIVVRILLLIQNTYWKIIYALSLIVA